MKRRGLNFMGYAFLDKSFIGLWESMNAAHAFMPRPRYPQYQHESSGEVSHPAEERKSRAGSCMTGCGCGFTDLG